MPNYQLDNQIKIINMLELFIFEKICSTPFLGSHKFILMASNEEDLRKVIYNLDDKGHFKESEEDKIKRLSNKPVKVFFPDQDGSDQVTKLDFEYRPKHYHEVFSMLELHYDEPHQRSTYQTDLKKPSNFHLGMN